jgi:hypothetical protein
MAIGPFTPTTPTVLAEGIDSTLNATNLPALDNNNWPDTFLVTNTSNVIGCYFNIATTGYIANISPVAGSFLLPGESMMFVVDAPGESQITGNALIAGTFAVGGSANLAITGGLNR